MLGAVLDQDFLRLEMEAAVMATKRKKKKTKRNIHRTATLVHRIAISLHAEAETLQKKTAWLVKALEQQFGQTAP